MHFHPNYTKIAHFFSWMFHPFMLPIYMMVVLLTLTSYAYCPLGMKLYLAWVVLLYTMIIPVLALGVLRSLGRISDYRIDNRKERFLPLLIGAICYLLCALTLAKIPSAMVVRKFMAAAACCEIFVLLVSLRWKISLHMTGMGALLAMFSLMSVLGVGTVLFPLIFAVAGAGILASSRLYLGCHNSWQILAGFSAGYLISALAILFL